MCSHPHTSLTYIWALAGTERSVMGPAGSGWTTLTKTFVCLARLGFPLIASHPGRVISPCQNNIVQKNYYNIKRIWMVHSLPQRLWHHFFRGRSDRVKILKSESWFVNKSWDTEHIVCFRNSWRNVGRMICRYDVNGNQLQRVPGESCCLWLLPAVCWLCHSLWLAQSNKHRSMVNMSHYRLIWWVTAQNTGHFRTFRKCWTAMYDK